MPSFNQFLVGLWVVAVGSDVVLGGVLRPAASLSTAEHAEKRFSSRRLSYESIAGYTPKTLVTDHVRML